MRSENRVLGAIAPNALFPCSVEAVGVMGRGWVDEEVNAIEEDHGASGLRAAGAKDERCADPIEGTGAWCG